MYVQSQHELDETFGRLIKELSPDLFIEAGAHTGEQSLKLQEALPSCDVVAYEANQFIHEKFVATFDNSNAEYLNIALSDQPGTAKFLIQRTDDQDGLGTLGRLAGNSSLKPKTGWEDPKILPMWYEEFEVNVDTIDNRYSKTAHERIAMWVDVEGHALEVLKGSSETLKRVKLIKIEVENIQHWADQHLDAEIMKYLESKGFVAKYRDTEAPSQYNIIFTKEDSVLVI